MELSKPICHSSQSIIVTTGIICPHLKPLFFRPQSKSRLHYIDHPCMNPVWFRMENSVLNCQRSAILFLCLSETEGSRDYPDDRRRQEARAAARVSTRSIQSHDGVLEIRVSTAQVLAVTVLCCPYCAVSVVLSILCRQCCAVHTA